MKPTPASGQAQAAPGVGGQHVTSSELKPAGVSVGAGVVGDGGLSWRLKALARAKVQAEAQGSDLSTVVAERWGSLTQLTSALTEGRAADGRCVLKSEVLNNVWIPMYSPR
jgi:hypothetical protein